MKERLSNNENVGLLLWPPQGPDLKPRPADLGYAGKEVDRSVGEAKEGL